MARTNLALIKKESLAHICSEIGVSPAFLAQKTKLDEDRILAWLNVEGNELPSIAQAKTVARILRIPFAGLYMEKDKIPTHHIPRLRNYRRMPAGIPVDDSALNIAIADLIRARDFLFLTEVELGIERPPVSLPSIAQDATPIEFAHAIRSFFAFDLSAQFRCKSPRQFYLYIRRKIEDKGIFVNSFMDIDVDVVRGIAIIGEGAPVIGINSNDRPPAKSFSMIHELTHIIKRQSALCNEMFSAFSAQQEEVFCNAVAGEALVPMLALRSFLETNDMDTITLDNVRSIAKRFCVSKEVVVRRLLDAGYLTQEGYEGYVAEIRRIFEVEREAERIARREGRGRSIPKSPARTAADKNSSFTCRALLIGYGEGYFSKQEISGILGMKEKHVPKFLSEVGKW